VSVIVTVKKSLFGASLVLVCLVSVACSSEKGGTATPVQTSTSSSGSSADPDVPKVSIPLDVSKYEGDPCQIVSKDLLSSLQYADPGKYYPRDDNVPDRKAGPSCSWILSGEGVSLQVVIGTGNRDRGTGGLAGLYAAHESGTVLKFLEPAPDVEGYPAIYIDTSDRRPKGNCGLQIGVADDLAIDVATEGYQGQSDSCGAAQQVAAAIVKTLKGA
jgi:hypothetical protein